MKEMIVPESDWYGHNSHSIPMTAMFIMIMQECFKVQQRIELLCK